MSPRLQGKKALITGSTSNIGRAIATAFAAEGAHVIVSGRDRDRGEKIVARIRETGGEADYVHAGSGRHLHGESRPRQPLQCLRELLQFERGVDGVGQVRLLRGE